MDEADSQSNLHSAIAAGIVFAVAFFLRLPSCYESFWLDELHSAWVVWGDLSEVAPRATAGHQSPFYFVGLWFWKQLAGGSEVALRLSSVLAVSAASSVLVIGLTRWSRSLPAGIAGGLILAIESNSLFFGTELRPYAFVVLFSSIACVLFLRLCGSTSRQAQQKTWIMLLVAILLATLCQPTAIGALAWLPITLISIWFVRDRRELLRFSLADVIVGMAACAIGLALWQATLGDSWQNRNTWAVFATASNLGQLWAAWDWSYLILVPVAIALGAHGMIGRSTSNRSSLFAMLLFAFVAFVGTAVFWSVSRLDLVPIWHRRFFVAVLPMLAVVCGCSVAVVHEALQRRRGAALVASLVAIAIVGMLAFHQDKLTNLSTHPVALVSRGEDWRAATQWVQANADPKDRIFLDPALIESSVRINSGANLTYEVFPLIIEMRDQLLQEPTFLTPRSEMPEAQHSRETQYLKETQYPKEAHYLGFALHGPYSVDRKWSNSGDIFPSKWPTKTSEDRNIFLIARRSASQFKKLKSSGAIIMTFGRITVVQQ
jgi:hypothetical protein